MTVESKSLVERLRAKTTPNYAAAYEAGINTHLNTSEPDALALEAADTIERLEREKEEALRENIDMMWQRRRADERAEAAESELSRLKSPMEGAKVSAEERDVIRLKYGSYAFVPSECRVVTFGDLLDDLDLYAAQARSAADTIKKLRMELGYEPDEELIAMAGGATAMLEAATGPKRAFDPAIRARRKGESNG